MEYININNALFTNDMFYSDIYQNTHIFTILNTAYEIRSLNSSITTKTKNNTIIPIEYYNKFQDKYIYDNKIFVFDNIQFNINIINIILSINNHKDFYILFSNKNIFPTIFTYFGKKLSCFKNSIHKYYPNSYYLIENISNEENIFNILQEKNIYGFSILLNIVNVYNVIICNDVIERLIFNDLELSSIKNNVKFIKKIDIVGN
ncbi:hypothetical protein [Brachyspira sp.]|uniref:hypothetical protein n=1 Tax=Brachyspira sp. TaxID=1977261 RepID=UPI0026353D6D|nr:hypothetical protein [Brachyspira sp.]